MLARDVFVGLAAYGMGELATYVIKFIAESPEYTDDPTNAYSLRHMQYNLKTVDFLVTLILLRMAFKVLQSNMGIRYKGHKAAANMANKIFHYILVAVRIVLTLFCVVWSIEEGFWIIDQTMYRLFVENAWKFQEDMDPYKRPFSSLIFPSANRY